MPHRCVLQDLREELRLRRAEQASLQLLWSQLQPEEAAEDSRETAEKLRATGSKLKLLLRQVDGDLSALQRRLVSTETARVSVLYHETQIEKVPFCHQDCKPASEQSESGCVSPQQLKEVSTEQRSELIKVTSADLCCLCINCLISVFAVQREGRPLPSALAPLPGVPHCSSAAPPPAAPPAAPLLDPHLREQPRLLWGQQLRQVFLPHAALHQRPPAHLTQTGLLNIAQSAF